MTSHPRLDVFRDCFILNGLAGWVVTSPSDTSAPPQPFFTPPPPRAPPRHSGRDGTIFRPWEPPVWKLPLEALHGSRLAFDDGELRPPPSPYFLRPSSHPKLPNERNGAKGKGTYELWPRCSSVPPLPTFSSSSSSFHSNRKLSLTLS